MNTHPLNKAIINAPARPRPMVTSVVTRVAVLRQSCHAASVFTRVSHIRANNLATAVYVAAPCSSAFTTQVAVGCAARALAATQLAVDKSVGQDLTVITSISRRANLTLELLADVRKPFQLGAICGVFVAGAKSMTATTCLFRAKSRDVQIPAAIYISRRPQRNYACNIRIDRRRMQGCISNVFVGRRRIALASAGVSTGRRLAYSGKSMLKIDRRHCRDTATGIQINRSHFGQHIMDLLPSVYRARGDGDLATFLKLPAEVLDEIKNDIDRMPSLWDVDFCPPEYLQLLAVTLGWPFAPAKHVETLRRELREAIPFYRRKGTIPAIMRSLENVGWRGRLFETFRGMLRTNRRAQLNSMRLAGTVYNQGVYRVESENIVAGVRDALVPHHPAGVRVFFLQRLQEHEDLSADIEAGFKLGFRRADVFRQHEIFSLNRDAVNGPRPLTVRRFVFETMLVRQGTSVNHHVSESWGIVEQWQARRPVPAVNAMRLNSTPVATTDLTPMRKSLELVCATAAETRRIPPMRLGKTRLKRGGFQPGSVYRWRFRQVEQAEETNAALDSAANDWLIRQWPRIENPAA